MTANSSATETDPYDLARFVQAQDHKQTFDTALEEISRGRKVSHWMWFVFPQIAGLGHSATAQHFAIRSLNEARAYSAHPVLGLRLRQSAQAMLTAPGTTAQAVLGGVDADKLRSSMTLFSRAAPDENLFGQVLERWFHGVADDKTDALLRSA